MPYRERARLEYRYFGAGGVPSLATETVSDRSFPGAATSTALTTQRLRFPSGRKLYLLVGHDIKFVRL